MAAIQEEKYLQTTRLSELKPTMSTIQFKCVGLNFNLSDLEDLVLTGNIIDGKTNIHYVKNEDYVPPPPKIKSTRGRKKIIKTNDRCPGGTFPSQIQFRMINQKDPYKPHVIKCFKTGNIQATGSIDPDYKNILPSILELIEFLRESWGLNIQLAKIDPFTRNYLSTFKKPDGIEPGEKLIIDCVALQKFVANEFIKDPRYKMEIIDVFRDCFPPSVIDVVERTMPINYLGINDVQYNPEKNNNVNIKLSRPVHNSLSKKDYDKAVTLKIMRSGKINIDGCRVINEVENTYLWVDYLARIGVEKRFIVKFKDGSATRVVAQLPDFLPDGHKRMVISADID